MASNPTKILTYDLDPALGKIMNDLKKFQGTFTTLYDRLSKLDVEIFNGDTKTVVQDLIDAYNNDAKGGARERLQKLEQGLIDLTKEIGDELNSLDAKIAGYSLDQLEEGDFDESFVYTDGNVTKHTSTGDRAFEVTYVYKTDGSGELQSSTKTFTKDDGTAVEITKTYTYTSGDITGIATSTTRTPPPETP
jgi:hypothetical protein